MKTLNSSLIPAVLILFGMNFCSSFASAQSPNDEHNTYSPDLSELSLPDRPISASDIADIQAKIQQAMYIISCNMQERHKPYFKIKRNGILEYTPENRFQNPMIFGLLQLEDWLKQQGCVDHVSFPLVGDTEARAAEILTSFPGQAPITIWFSSKNGGYKEFHLSVFVEAVSLEMASFYEKP